MGSTGRPRRGKSRYLSADEIRKATPEELVLAFTDRAEKMADRVKKEDEDLRQEAYVGLVLAARTYNPDKGPFFAWATFYIKQTLSRARARDAADLIALPSVVRQRLARVLAARDELKAMSPDGRANISDLAAATGETEKTVRALLNAPRMTLADTRPNEERGRPVDDPAEQAVEEDGIDDLLARLEARELMDGLPAELAAECEEWLADGDIRKLRKLSREVKDVLDGEAYQPSMF